MRLTKVQISGYRSFKSETTVTLDEKITVFLGANDHGKSNFLAALEHLNEEKTFDEERDLNWDEQASSDNYPCIRYYLKPEKNEVSDLSKAIFKEARLAFLAREIEGARAELEAVEAELEALRPDDDSDAEEEEGVGDDPQPVRAEDPREIQLSERISEIEKIIEHWKCIQCVAQTSSDGDIQSVDIDDAIATRSKRISILENDQKRLNDRKAVAAKSLEQAKGSTDSTQISSAERSLQSIQQEISKLSQLISEHRWSIDRFEEHRRLSSVGSSPEYMKLVDAVVSQNGVLPEIFVMERRGVRGALTFVRDGEPEATPEYLKLVLPHVQIFSSVDRLPDEVSAETIQNEESAFMRGIFYYAGLPQDDWPKIFSQNDHTTKQLEDAGKTLNDVLRRDWRQGQELEFKLQHRDGGIILVIRDPKVLKRFVRISRRSSGFTHFFGLKTVLHAYERESSAASYIWLFDEPGISLHPDGQYDLLQSLDTVSRQNQVIYTTHSLFMIDKNYPARHRLLAKKENGTQVDGKPFLGNWRAAIDALGLALPGTILFASYILLVEGPADPILLNALFQKSAELGLHDLDINPLSIMPTGDTQNADALARILLDSTIKPRIVALYDGDEGGKRRKAKLEKVLRERDQHVLLEKEKTIEDYLPSFGSLFVDVAVEYAVKTFDVDAGECKARVERYLKNLPEELEQTGEGGGGEKAKKSPKSSNVDRVLLAIREEAKQEEKPSKVGIAREYAHKLLDPELSLQKSELGTLMKLVELLQSSLKLPTRSLKQDTIVADLDK